MNSNKKDMEKYRYFLKDSIRKEVDFSRADQSIGVPPPPVEKPADKNAEIIKLPRFGDIIAANNLSLSNAVLNRQSVRQFKNESISQEELSFLLWATQGVKEVINEYAVMRTVPSAGCRHSFETYLAVLNVDGLLEGIYRYLPLEHALVFHKLEENLASKMTAAAYGQKFCGTSAVTMYWACIPYRMEWRYSEASHKVIALDAGHICQNLYLTVQTVGCGTCAVAAYDQELTDSLIGVDGKEEFTVYLAPVGKV